MNPYFAPSEAELLAHSSFLEDLSRRLVHDPQTADDIVQDTWLAALENPPRHSINVSGWLGAVASNLARRSHRSRDRQVHREAEAARPEGIPGVDENFDREASLSRVVRAVEALPEPYRTVVFLRYLEGLPPREIAEKLNTGVPTIKSQLHRGLEQLRAELEEEFGQDDSGWRGVLCACFGWRLPELTTSPVGPVGAEPSLGPFNAFAALLIVSGFAAVLLGRQWEPRDSGDEILAANFTTRQEDLAEAAPTERAPVAPPISVPTSPDPANALQVVVVDHEGSPVESASVWLAGTSDFELRATTDASGHALFTFEEGDAVPPRADSEMQSVIPPIAPRLGIKATAAGHSSSLISWVEVERANQGRLTLELAKHGFRLSGVVQDEHGVVIRDARVERHDPREGVRRSSASDLAVRAVSRTRTDALGRFDFQSLPVGLYWLRFEAEGFAITWQRRVLREAGTDLELEVQLDRAGTVRGYVLGPDGQPVANARVWTRTEDQVHTVETRSSDSGAFELSGIAPGRRFLFVQGGVDGALATRWQLLVKPGETLEWNAQLSPLDGIRIQVVDEHGVPRTELPLHMRVKSRTNTNRVDATTDAEGRVIVFAPDSNVKRIDFALVARYGTMLTFPEANLTEVRAGDEDHVVVIPRERSENGQLRFDLTNAQGQPFEEFALLGRGPGDGVLRRIAVGLNSKLVHASDVLPGRMELVLSCTGIGHLELDPVQIEPGELLELPRQQAPATGTVRLDWQDPGLASSEADLVQYLQRTRSRPLVLQTPRDQNQQLRDSYALLPGEYGLRIFEDRQLVRTLRFTIQEGFETLVLIEPGDEK